MEETMRTETATNEQDEKEKHIRVRRIGSITFGGMLVAFGLMFLIHVFVPALSYAWIFRLWPIVFISLGVEVLAAGIHRGREEQIYDGMAIFLMAVLVLFSMGMAVLDMAIRYEGWIYF
ncbi:MAG: hypothetical protein HFI30_14970 [Lachnospiraceae bacterium]|jgi:hypothetical protein|nr:hypothetical protein [Lachnospiraceae bacterium]